MIRQFKPVEKIIVLIPCHSLQANYAWPYVIVSRLNDLNYIVNTHILLTVFFMTYNTCISIIYVA
jgi:hypothetical protein